MPSYYSLFNGWNGLCAHVSRGTVGTGGNVIPQSPSGGQLISRYHKLIVSLLVLDSCPAIVNSGTAYNIDNVQVKYINFNMYRCYCCTVTGIDLCTNRLSTLLSADALMK